MTLSPSQEFDIKQRKKNSDCEFEIVKKSYQQALNDNDRNALKQIFDYYKDQGQIVFTTFHQSYGYEEFVEGIKPCGLNSKCEDDVSGEVRYIVQDGVFKSISEIAQDKIIITDNLEINLDKIWKVSLGGSGVNNIKDDCYQNSRIRFAYDEEFPNNLETYDKLNNPLNALYNKMRVGDVIVSLSSNKSINQIGIVDGEYEYLDNENEFKHSRKVKWLFKAPEEIDFFKINNDSVFSNPAIHEIFPNKELLLKLFPTQNIEKNNFDKNYIIIIDEINRGNISKIFGELITLIEPSKRIGADEAIKLRLPYSNEEFGVPQNLYILGTMNTADRSIALMDTALRRRFHFEEMMPDLTTLSEKDTTLSKEASEKSEPSTNDLKVDNINIRLMLKKSTNASNTSTTVIIR